MHSETSQGRPETWEAGLLGGSELGSESRPVQGWGAFEQVKPSLTPSRPRDSKACLFELQFSEIRTFFKKMTKKKISNKRSLKNSPQGTFIGINC